MATIPIGPGRRVAPQRAPMVQIANVGAPAQAVANLGATGANFGLHLKAQQDAEAENERRRQEATRQAAERARDTAHLQAVEDQLADLHDEIGGQVLQGAVPKADAERIWSERSRKLIDDGTAGFSDFGRETVSPRLTGTAARLGNSVRRTVEKKDRQDITADMGMRLERLQRDYAANPAKAEQEAAAVFENLGPFSTMTADQLQKARQTWLENAQFTAGYEAVSRGRNDAKALAEAEGVVAGLKHLDPQKRAVLQDRIAGYRLSQEQRREIAAQRAAREAERHMNKARAEFESFQALADKGGALDPAYVDRVSAATAGTPYQAGIQALAKVAAENGGIAAQPIAVQRATLDALDARIAQGGRTPELDKRREQVAKVVTAAEADLKRDPMRAGLERGIIDRIEPLNLSGGIEGAVQQLQQRVADAERVGLWAGEAVSPLTQQEAHQLGTMLANTAPEQLASALAVMAEAIPPKQLQAVARQIDEKDRALSLAMAAGASKTTHGRLLSELMLRGSLAAKDKQVKEDTAAETGLRASIVKEIGEAIPQAARADIIDAARFAYLGKRAMGEPIDVGNAVRLAVGGSLVEHNGRRIPVPAGVDLPKVLANYPTDRIAVQSDAGSVYAGPLRMGVDEFIAALPSAQLEPDRMGSYMVRLNGWIVTGSGKKEVLINSR